MKTLTRRAVTVASTLALAAGSALVATAPAQATDPAPAFTVAVTQNTPKITTAATPGGKSWKISGTFTGLPSDANYGTSDVNGDGVIVYYDLGYPTVEVVKSRVASPSLPLVASSESSSLLNPGAPITTTLLTGAPTTPGVYRLVVPVEQRVRVVGGATSSTLLQLTAVFEIRANTKVSAMQSGLASASWRSGQTAKLTLQAPAYQHGAKATLYVKKKGKKKFVKHSTAKLRESGSTSTAKFKVKRLRTGDKVYLKIAKVTYSPAYKTASAKVR